MSLPLSLAYALQKVSGYSTNYFRLETTNQDTATNNSTITLNLPTNVLINLKSLSTKASAQTQKTKKISKKHTKTNKQTTKPPLRKKNHQNNYTRRGPSRIYIHRRQTNRQTRGKT